MNLGNAIMTLCPRMTPEQVAAAVSRAYGQSELLLHGQIPTADYRLPPITVDEGRYTALGIIVNTMYTMLDTYFSFGPDGLAATQLGIPFPLIVLIGQGGKAVVVQHPRIESLGGGCTTTLEACGSLPHLAMYLVRYPAAVKVSFNLLGHGEVRLQVRDTGSWRRPTIGVDSVNILHLLHELRHLRGLTAANGWLLHPRDVPVTSWEAFPNNLVLDPDFREEVLRELGALKAWRQAPRSNNSGGRKVWEGQLSFLAYLNAYADAAPNTQLLLPTPWWNRRPYRVITIQEYAEEVERLLQ